MERLGEEVPCGMEVFRETRKGITIRKELKDDTPLVVVADESGFLACLGIDVSLFGSIHDERRIEKADTHRTG